MCLAIVHKDNKPLTVGYKVMSRMKDGSLTGLYMSQSFSRPLRRWLHSRDYRTSCCILASDYKWYESGWHIYRKKKDADRSHKRSSYRDTSQAVVRVRVRNIVASGLSTLGEEVVVAKQILITEVT